MPLKKLLLKPGVNRENTRYTNEGRWYDCDKVRFRQGTPEKIGGWSKISDATYLGVARALWSWTTLENLTYVAVGTNLKYYVELGGGYNDITPARTTFTSTDTDNCFETENGSTNVTVTITDHGALDGDFVIFSGAVDVGGVPAANLNQEHQITFVDVDTFIISVDTAATSDTTGGGTNISAEFQINTGPAVTVPLSGWGSGTWSSGAWGFGQTSPDELRIWSHANFGEDLIFGPRGGGVYYWDASSGVGNRGVALSSLGGASNVPTVQNFILVSDISRFVFCFGANELGGSTQDPMLIRWSDQEDATNWTPAATNQAGDLRLSRGTKIIGAKQSRQEILVWTDAAMYSLQYVGAPAVWTAQLVGENISITSQNAVAYANGVSFWMGKDKFYKYDGRTQPLPCDVRRYVFSDINTDQYAQVFAGTNEAFHEIWWFYCSSGSEQIDKYVVYNYLEQIWYFGSLDRTAWLDSGLRDYPLAATYSNNLVNHEFGVDDNETGTPAAISAYITSAEFDLDDGHKFAFVWRVIPDVTFDGSTAESPALTMSLLPLRGSGSGYNTPRSEGGTNSATVTRTATVPVEEYTDQVYTRVRGRQMAIKVESDAAGVKWQLGAPRIDLRPDGRR